MSVSTASLCGLPFASLLLLLLGCVASIHISIHLMAVISFLQVPGGLATLDSPEVVEVDVIPDKVRVGLKRDFTFNFGRGFQWWHAYRLASFLESPRRRK